MRSSLTVIFIAAFLDLARGSLKVTYLGCYQDNGGRRLLPLSFKPLATSNTPTTCALLCRSEGYLYSGVEYSTQCFCGNEEPSKELEVAKSECDARCSGDKNKFCGGLWKLQVYQTGLEEYGPWPLVKLGCYQDSGHPRLFLSSQKNLPTHNTPLRCAKICRSEGFAYSGVEYGEQCFCGHDKPADNKKAKNSECNMGCSGDKDSFCGGYWRLEIFETGLQSSSRWNDSSLGCYTDSHKRLFPSSMRTLPNNSPLICTSLCRAEEYIYSGLQSGDQCFCGDDLPGVELKVKDTECNMGCSGDKDNFCGGHWRLQIFETKLDQSNAEVPFK